MGLQALDAQLHQKKKELDTVGNKLAGAGAGALLTRGLAIGAVAGAFLGREKARKVELEREISTIEQKIKETKEAINRLESKYSKILNDFQNNRARYESTMRQNRADLERRVQSEQDPGRHQMLEKELYAFQDTINQQERQDERKKQSDLDAVRREIDALTF